MPKMQNQKKSKEVSRQGSKQGSEQKTDQKPPQKPAQKDSALPNLPVQIPGVLHYEFKKKFIERYSAITDFEKFKYYCLCFLRRSIRVNTLVATVSSVKKSIEAKGWKLTPIPWCKEGFWIEHKGEINEEGEVIKRRDVGNLLEFKTGKIYVQEAVSMLPPLALKPRPGDVVLDMCAAPGSKTTQMAAMMKNEGLIIANDYKGMRITSLGMNLQRCQVTNTVISLLRGEVINKERIFASIENLSSVEIEKEGFDKVLVDAPCSGTGTIRKSLKTIRMWNPNMVKKIAGQQKKLILAGFDCLKKGGVMVYSTCSLEPEENEGVVDFLLSKRENASVEEVSSLPGLIRGKAVLEFEGKSWDKSIEKTIRVWPQDNDTEGFFVAKIKKS